MTDQVVEFTQPFYAAADYPASAAIADVDGDHMPDLVVTILFSNSVSILHGNGDGTFTQMATYGTGFYPVSIAVADFNDDNRADIIVRNDNETVSVLMGNGNGTFKPQVTYATGSGYGARSLGVADFNGDGKMDVVVSNSADDTVSVLLGKGDGTFESQATYGTVNGPVDIAVADLNGDGKADLVVSNGDEYNSSISILLGNGDGTFQPQTTFAATSYVSASIAVGDLNGDHRADLVITDGEGMVSVLLGKGDGTFGAPTTYHVPVLGNSPSSSDVTIADVNDDDKADIVIGNGSHDVAVSVMLGDGQGGFGPMTNYQTGGSSDLVIVADVNGDGQKDFVVTDSYGIRVLVQTSGAAVANGQISGAAYVDQNTNNVRDAGDGGLAGLQVRLLDQTGAVIASTTTDANGLYSFGSLSDGTYQLSFHAPNSYQPDQGVLDANGDLVVGGVVVANGGASTLDEGFFVPSPPRITGISAHQTTKPGTPMHPFLGVSVADGFPAASETLTITLDGWGGTLSGNGLTRTGLNVYQLTGSAAEVTAALQGLTFRPNPAPPSPQNMGMNLATHFTLTDVSSANPDGPSARFETEVAIAAEPAGPITITSGGTASWNENVPDTTVVYTVSTDVPGGLPSFGMPSQKTYSLSGEDADLFHIDSMGHVTFKVMPDFEAPADSGGDNVYHITVQASDGSSTATKDVAITVTDQVVEFTQKDATADNPQSAAIANFNGDHNPDLAVLLFDGKSMSVLLGNGDGTFTQTATYETGAYPSSMGVADFNGDHKADIVVKNQDGMLSVLLGNGDGTFQPQMISSITGSGYSGARSLGVADFNGDGKMDVVVSNYFNATVSVLLGKGETHGIFVDGLAARKDAEIGSRLRQIRLFAPHALFTEGESHIIGGHLVAIVEFHALAQGHDQFGRSLAFPGGRQMRLEARPAAIGRAHEIPADQRVEQ